MRAWAWILLCAVPALQGQEAGPASPWIPGWELTLRSDRLSGLPWGMADVQRESVQLRLAWKVEGEAFRLRVATRSAVGSDGNQANVPLWDLKPSNGTQLDLARLDWFRRTPGAFVEVRLGFQDNALVSLPSLWERDLRLLGAGIQAGVRDALGYVPEAGMRFAAGRVRTVEGGNVDLAAAQVILKAETGPVSWLAHADRWDLVWKDRGYDRQSPIPGHPDDSRQHLVLDAAGLGAKWNARVPLELRDYRHRNRETRETGQEFQAVLGSRERPWWPMASYVWQRLSRTGTLFPVNGDQWWWMWGARGSRYEVALPLPSRWIVSLAYLSQRAYGAPVAVERRQLTVTRRF